MDIDNLEAGRELDALVEVAVFSGTCARCEKHPAGLIVRGVVYCSAECEQRISDMALDHYDLHRGYYSEDIAAAWLVVEKLQGDTRDGDDSCLIVLHYAGPHYVASFDPCPYDVDGLDGAPESFPRSARGETAPLAICRAALKAKGAGDA